MRAGRLLAQTMSALIGAGIAGCAVLSPLPRETTVAERLSAIPLAGAPVKGRVTIHWNEHAVPFIEADDDEDAAFALGLVHAHLRLGQMEIFRRISQGRLAEMAGPIAADIDHALRIVDFGRAAAEIEARLPAETRAWLEAFVRGINHYQRHVATLPAEFRLLGLAREPWTVRDVITFGRLAGTDVNWLVWFGALDLRARPDWPALWARLVESGTASVPSFEGRAELAALDTVLGGIGRTGSNALALSPARSATGAAVMASDPHLGISVPDLWLIAGLKSPSYHVVGLMAPGLPVFAIGRNPWIAWSGTNMRAASSELVDLAGVPAEAITERTERIGVRWWLDREITVRETRWGPVISDAPQLAKRGGGTFALRWIGHRASDEITAMLRVARARTFAGFRAAFETFAVPGQNMLYADAGGTIGQVMAVELPARSGAPADIVVDRATSDAAWDDLVGVARLPAVVDPPRGFLVSANNRPARTSVPVGYFFSPDDRIVRMTELIERNGRASRADVEAIQRDVYMTSSVTLRDLYVGLLKDLVPEAATPPGSGIVAALAGWDGRYDADSQGAAAFEAFHNAFLPRLYAELLGADDGAAYARFGRVRSMIVQDIARAGRDRLAPLLAAALAAAAEATAEYPRWGDMHRLALSHPLSAIPLIGGRFRFADLPASGGDQTVMKAAARGGTGRHDVSYGSNARFVTDLGDVDSSGFVLLGGQDGWFGSPAFLDQVPLWRAGGYIDMPLTIETVRARFAYKTRLGG